MEDKDIKILEEMKFWEGCETTIDEKWCKAIENLLKRYKELEEGCKTCVIRNDLNEYVENSIPISVIQNKIDELDEENHNEYLTNYYGAKQPNRMKELEYKKQVLQELLQESKK